MTACYEEAKPPAELSRWIAAIWQLRGTAASTGTHRVLPDGCMDLLFDVDAWRCRSRAQASSMLIGPMTRATLAPMSPRVDLFGIRLRPGVVRSLAVCSALELQDRVVSSEDAGVAPALDLDWLLDAASLAARTQRMRPWLLERFTAGPAPDDRVRAIINLWQTAALRNQTLPSVAVVARRSGLSERALERRFAGWVGYTPSQFRRLARFRSALELSAAGSRSWVQTALQCGYADQAHLSRDFRDFALTTATGWAREQRPVGFLQDGKSDAL